MAKTRAQKAKLSMIFSLCSQVISAICGFVIPKLMLRAYGSEMYGATTSIAQFLSYITLLEGGIGSVARAALYKPLADREYDAINSIYSEIQHFFRSITLMFLLYTALLSVGYKYIAHLDQLGLPYVASLVIVISISTIAQYYFGISNSILLQADQRQYINSITTILTTVVNTVLIIALIHTNVDILVVKFGSSCAFILKPVILSIYARKNYHLRKANRTEESKKALDQKWTALGQHIAYFINSNTDVFVLTVFANVTLVAVYSIYHLIVATIRNIVISFTSGMEALFGNMIAKNENINSVFNMYETLLSVISTVLFSTTAAVIVPFIKVYMSGVDDANYIEPVFGILLTLAFYAYCLREPYGAVVYAAGHFKQTKIAAYGEAVLNIGLSILLVIKFGLIGVAIGTLVAMVFRTVYYAFYISKNICSRPFSLFVKRQGINILNFAAVFLCGNWFSKIIKAFSYFTWALLGVEVIVIAGVITIAINTIFYRESMKSILKRFIKA